MSDDALRDAIRRLNDPWRPTRNQAAEELRQAGEAALPVLGELLAGDEPDPDLAHYAIWVLEQLDTPAARALCDDYFERHG